MPESYEVIEDKILIYLDEGMKNLGKVTGMQFALLDEEKNKLSQNEEFKERMKHLSELLEELKIE